MLWLKSCSRCRGDLFEGGDVYGAYVACAQCGKHLTDAEEGMLRRTGRITAVLSGQGAGAMAKAAR